MQSKCQRWQRVLESLQLVTVQHMPGREPWELGQALVHTETGLSVSPRGLRDSLRRTLPKEWAYRPNGGCQTFSVKARE